MSQTSWFVCFTLFSAVSIFYIHMWLKQFNRVEFLEKRCARLNESAQQWHDIARQEQQKVVNLTAINNDLQDVVNSLNLRISYFQKQAFEVDNKKLFANRQLNYLFQRLTKLRNDNRALRRENRTLQTMYSNEFYTHCRTQERMELLVEHHNKFVDSVVSVSRKPRVSVSVSPDIAPPGVC